MASTRRQQLPRASRMRSPSVPWGPRAGRSVDSLGLLRGSLTRRRKREVLHPQPHPSAKPNKRIRPR
eukprot:8691479-Pyramimonas_sp.AAC.1